TASPRKQPPPCRSSSSWSRRPRSTTPAARKSGNCSDNCARTSASACSPRRRSSHERATLSLDPARISGGRRAAAAPVAAVDARPTYRGRAQQARTGRQLELARVCYLRLLRDDNPQPADMFGLYQTFRDLKQDEMADALLRQLVVWKGKGYAPAHLARARILL